MEQLTKIVQEISSFMWGWPMIIMLLGTHLYLTIRLRFPHEPKGHSSFAGLLEVQTCQISCDTY